MTIEKELELAKELHNETRKKRQQANSYVMQGSSLNLEIPYSSQVIMTNAEWYRTFAKKTLFALVFISSCFVLLAIGFTYTATRPAEVISIYQDEEGRVLQLEHMRNLQHTDSSVLAWSADRLHKINHLSFAEYNNQLQSISNDFTKGAYQNYRKALEHDKRFERLLSERLTSYIRLSKAPIILNDPNDGNPVWEIQFEYTLFLGGGSTQTKGSNLEAIMVVEQISRAESLSGLVIRKLLVKESGVTYEN